MKHKGRIIVGAVLLFFLQFPLLHTFWLTQAGALLIHQDAIAQADAILVLGGGRGERVLQGVDLFKRKYGDKVLFTGEYGQLMQDEPDHWAFKARKLAVRRGLPEDRAILILDSKSTYDDAVLSRESCREHGIKSLIVVSEPYHTRRAFFTFRKVYKDSGIRFAVYPVQKSWYKKDKWWKTEEGVLATFNEYVKLGYYLLNGYLI